MHSLRESRRLARMVAAWLLVWFAVMQGTALLRAPAGFDDAAAVADFAADHADHAEHADHAHHADHAGAHEEHTGADHIAQCPGCLFSTAPPPPDFPLAQAVHATGPVPASAPGTAPRAHLLPQPPARGPPRFS